MFFLFYFLFHDTATTEIYTYSHTLSLHDALPISLQRNRDNIASLHCQPSTCAAAASTNRSASSSVGSPFNFKHCWRTRSAKSAPRVSGTQNWTGRKIGRAHV